MTVTDSPSSARASNGGDLESALAAIQRRDPSGPVPLPPAPAAPARSARANRRAALGLALVAILVAGVIQMLTATPDTRGERSTESRASVVFGNAQAGACLNWPAGEPDRPSFVQCRDDHMFEVAKAVDMTGFGEPCQAAVRQYLGPRYDPDGRFTIGVLWAGDADATGDRKLLCGLQLLGVGGSPAPFQGMVAELDQSKVWPTGTCLGIDGGRSTDVPVDCAGEHAVEITGSVGLAERFPGASPPIAEQDVFIREACTRATEAYLAPVPLQATGVALNYGTLSPASWSAGSRQVWCGVASPGEQGLQPLVGSVRGPMIEAPPPSAPPPSSPPPPPPPSESPAAEPEPAPAAETPAVEAPSAAPTESAPPASPASPAPPAPSAESPPPAPPSQELGPPPGPAPGAEPPPPNTDPPPGILRIPGVPDITLPGYVPPAPPPPAAPAPAQ